MPSVVAFGPAGAPFVIAPMGSALTDSLLARADASGYEALAVTVDLPAGGKCKRDLHRVAGTVIVAAAT